MTLDSGRLFRREDAQQEPPMYGQQWLSVSCTASPQEPRPSLTLFFSTRPAVWYCTGPA